MRIFHYYNDNGFPVLTYAVKLRDSDGNPFEGNKIKFDQTYGVHNKRARELLDLNTQIGFPRPVTSQISFDEVKKYIIDPLEDKLREIILTDFIEPNTQGTGGY